jgi:rubrerythrin
MCLIPPEHMKRYEQGRAPLGKEFECRSCGDSGIMNVWKNKQPVCPKCSSPDITLGETHMPGGCRL